MRDESALVDTNILVYAYDNSNIEKKEKSRKLMEKCWNSEISLAVSLQNLSELYVTITKKITNPLDKENSTKIVKQFIDFNNWKKLIIKPRTIIKSMEISQKYNVDYWDSLIAATMIENNVSVIYTENTKDFNKIKEIKAVNPLK